MSYRLLHISRCTISKGPKIMCSKLHCHPNHSMSTHTSPDQLLSTKISERMFVVVISRNDKVQAVLFISSQLHLFRFRTQPTPDMGTYPFQDSSNPQTHLPPDRYGLRSTVGFGEGRTSPKVCMHEVQQEATSPQCILEQHVSLAVRFQLRRSTWGEST